MLWYVAYGSNMSRSRFTAYLSGGGVPGSAVHEVGARDRAAPRESRAIRIDGRLYFADRSSRWDAGVAYLDPTAPTQVLVRAWLVTTHQFSDVVAQEMRRPIGTSVPIADVVAQRSLSLGPGRYETCVHVGDLDGLPMLTFTRPVVAPPEELTPPSEPYLQVIAAGLEEAHGLTHEEALDYLRRGHVDRVDEPTYDSSGLTQRDHSACGW